MGIFEWGEKRFARGISKAMIRSYKILKENNPSIDEFDLIKLVLSTRPGKPAEHLLKDIALSARSNKTPIRWVFIVAELVISATVGTSARARAQTCARRSLFCKSWGFLPCKRFCALVAKTGVAATEK